MRGPQNVKKKKNYLTHKNTICFKYSKDDFEGYVKEISASSGIEVLVRVTACVIICYLCDAS